MKKKVLLITCLCGPILYFSIGCKHPPRHAVFINIDYSGPKDTTSFPFADSSALLTKEGDFYVIQAMKGADTVFLIRFEADTIDGEIKHKVISIDPNSSLPSRIHGFVQFRPSLLSDKALDGYMKPPCKSFSLSYGVNDSSAVEGYFAGCLFAPKNDTTVFISGHFSLCLPTRKN